MGFARDPRLSYDSLDFDGEPIGYL